MADQRIIVKNALRELAGLMAGARAFFAPHNPSDRCAFVVDLALEEIFTNIVKYAHDDQGKHEVTVDFRVCGTEAEVTFTDSGHPFDPDSAPAPDPEKTLENLKPGGLGLVMTRSMARSMDYRRENGLNILTIRVALNS